MSSTSARHIALLCGGYSGEYEISLQSAETVEKHLRVSGYEVYKIQVTRDGWDYVHPSGQRIAIDKNDFSFTLHGKKVVFDVVFNMIHGTPGKMAVCRVIWICWASLTPGAMPLHLQ